MTNASNVAEGSRVVVACVGSVVQALAYTCVCLCTLCTYTYVLHSTRAWHVCLQHVAAWCMHARRFVPYAPPLRKHHALAVLFRCAQGESLTKKTVGGRPSEGVLCDAPMLGWTGGGAGAAALVPEACAPGDRPPEKRPRMDGK